MVYRLNNSQSRGTSNPSGVDIMGSDGSKLTSPIISFVLKQLVCSFEISPSEFILSPIPLHLLYVQGVEPRKNISERWPVYAASLSYLVVVAAGFPTVCCAFT